MFQGEGLRSTPLASSQPLAPMYPSLPPSSAPAVQASPIRNMPGAYVESETVPAEIDVVTPMFTRAEIAELDEADDTVEWDDYNELPVVTLWNDPG